MHFASELFDTHPRYVQLKSMLMTFFNGEEIDAIHLAGLESVISVSCAPVPSNSVKEIPEGENLPQVHLRVYTSKLLASGTKIPRIELTSMGPSIDFSLRRHQPADDELMKQALRRPKIKQKDIEKGLGKKRKNLEVDDMGDLRGQLHVGKQDLDKMQTRKMKGLKDPSVRLAKKRKVDAAPVEDGSGDSD